MIKTFKINYSKYEQINVKTETVNGIGSDKAVPCLYGNNVIKKLE